MTNKATKGLFPDGFLWGASSSAWQVEGGIDAGGRTPAIIDLNSRKKAPFADNTHAADHYRRFREDVELMRSCGFSSYRFSIAWSRIVPNADGKPNPEGIKFYDDLINCLIDAKITPIVTLYHYDMPVWVRETLGGWRSRNIIPAFESYVRICFEHFGDRVKYWLSINEQNMQIVYGDWLGVSDGCMDWFREKWDVNHIMNICHAKAVVACHERVRDGMIGPVPGYVPIYPETCSPDDQIAAMNAEELTQKLWNDTYFYGDYSGFLRAYWEKNGITPDIRPGDISLFKSAKIDYFGFNCYRSNVARHSPEGSEERGLSLNKDGKKGGLIFPNYPGLYELCQNPHVETNDWDWEIDPVAMRYSLRYLWDHYRLPIMITENGFGAHESPDADGKIHDSYRIDFLRDQIEQVGLAIADGVDVLGYNPWSFTDLLSTGNGMAKRYGLVYVDATDEQLSSGRLPSFRRIPKDSFYWYSDLIKTNGRNLQKEDIYAKR